MNQPSPLIPQGSITEQKHQSRSRVKVAFFCVVGAHVAVILVALLAQGCKREQPAPPADIVDTSMDTDTNLYPTDTAFPTYTDTTTAPPAIVDTHVAPIAPVVAPAPITPTVTEHVIQKGDTFYSLSKLHNVTMKAIQDANPGVDPTKLKIGQKIVIPAPTATPAPAGSATITETGEQIYIVKSGDNLSTIASRYQTTVKEIRAANNLTTDRIIVNQKLKIPVKAEPPAMTPTPAPQTDTPLPLR